ncbi:Pentatricopeptide repeat [Dillenia turbinata]|uniref:Pentatricopeptide repeat n=1 Tax=Dillenia turbinata TaxID=194707 RepID=A0AAN8V8H1_9MAGN
MSTFSSLPVNKSCSGISGIRTSWELASALKEAKPKFDSAGVKLVAVSVSTPNKVHILAEQVYCCGESKASIKIAQSATKYLRELNSLLAELVRSDRNIDCLLQYGKIHSSYHLKPDHYTLSTALTACARLLDFAAGNQLHAYVIQTGFKEYPHVGNTLLSFYAKSKNLASVKQVFKDIKDPDVYSWTTLLSSCTKLGQVDYACSLFNQSPQDSIAVWNAIITGCAENGRADITLNMFRKIHCLGIRHDNYTFASVLSLCCPELLHVGRMIHSLVIKTGFLVMSSVVNALLTMYFRCGIVLDAYELFEESYFRCNQITYNAMIAGLVSMERNEEAMMMFVSMLRAGVRPTDLTFVSILSSCVSENVGHQVHGHAVKTGYISCTCVSNAAITMYTNVGNFHAAEMIFQYVEMKDLVTWNAMITCYAQRNCDGLAHLAYLQMQRAGIKPDEFTFGSLLASADLLEVVEMIQALVYKNGFISKIEVSNALVSAYSKHGKIGEAHQIFNCMTSRNIVSWNTIISGLLINGYLLQGLDLFSKLLKSDLKPNIHTLNLVLSICASFSALRIGKEIHGYILRLGLFLETLLGNALITMYAKCGMLDLSLRVFEGMDNKDGISWNAMISAYAQNGKGEEAVHYFKAMQDLGLIIPDQTTFTVVLSACSHAGLVNDGISIFNFMVNDYGIAPGVDHLSCMVDLLGRAGYLNEAENLLNRVNLEAGPNPWWTLFSACAAHGNLGLGRTVAGILLETEQNDPAVHVLLSNIYATAGLWEEAARIRELMERTRSRKQRGCSWITS